jgi:biopolymer transport protein ExbB
MFITKSKNNLLSLSLIAAVSAIALILPSTMALAADALSATGAVTEKVANPYGLDALWNTGDFVAKGTLMILVVMSMGSWYIIATKFIEQLKLFRQASAISESFWKAGSIQNGVKALEKGNAFGFIAENALEASQRHNSKLAESMDLSTWLSTQIQSSIENVQSRLQDGLAFLASVGSIAPFVGLFGTVWGIYHALTAIGIAGQASIDKVAGPVGEALIMTAIGLAVAVPAVLGYNWLVRRNKVAMEQVRGFGAEVHAIMIGASGKVS